MSYKFPFGDSALVLGAGKTGVSAVRWLLSRGLRVFVWDADRNAIGISSITDELPDAKVFLEDLSNSILNKWTSLFRVQGFHSLTFNWKI